MIHLHRIYFQVDARVRTGREQCLGEVADDLAVKALATRYEGVNVAIEYEIPEACELSGEHSPVDVGAAARVF